MMSNNRRKDHSSSSSCLQARYCLALTTAMVLFIPTATRKSFALILTHITASQSSAPPEEIVFTECTVFNSSRDVHIDMGENTMFFLHSLHAATFVLMRIPAIFLTAYISPKHMVTVCLGVGSVLTICLPYAIVENIPLLFVIRGLQGVLFGVPLPCILSILAHWTTETDSGRVYSLSFAGSYPSPAISALLTGAILCYVNWSAAIYLFGSVGIGWTLLWHLRVYSTPEEHPSLPPAERDLHQRHRANLPLHPKQAKHCIPWRDILTSLPVWALFVAYFSRYFVYNLIVVAQPQYFMDAFGINIADISLLTTIPHVGVTIFSTLGGYTLDKLIKKGLSTTLTRKLVFTIGHLTEGTCLIGLYFTDDWGTAITLLSVGVSVGGMADTGYLPLAGDLSPIHAGVISGIASTGGIGSFVSIFIASFLCGNNQGLAGWQKLYLIAGLVSSGSVLFFNMCGQAKLQPWALGADFMVDEMEKLMPCTVETDDPQRDVSEKNKPKIEES